MPLFSKKASKPGDFHYNKFEGTELDEFSRDWRERCVRTDRNADKWASSFGAAFQQGVQPPLGGGLFNGVHADAYRLEGVMAAKQPMKAWTHSQMPHVTTLIYSDPRKLRELESRCGYPNTSDKTKSTGAEHGKLVNYTKSRMEKTLRARFDDVTERNPRDTPSISPPLHLPHNNFGLPFDPNDATLSQEFKHSLMTEKKNREWQRTKQVHSWRSGTRKYGSDRDQFLKMYHAHRKPLSRTHFESDDRPTVGAFRGACGMAHDDKHVALPCI
mmetsp:Transcript_27352/g.45733  ORF Transcript_27352/g.45733 Transcript_27352/m.45733 type:complete len:272 (-) Transcript_27352:182-997(-)